MIEAPIRHSVASAAARMGVSEATIRRLMVSGDLLYHRVRRRIVIREEAIRDYEWRSEKAATGGLSSSCNAESASSAGSRQDGQRETPSNLKASSVVKSLMR